VPASPRGLAGKVGAHQSFLAAIARGLAALVIGLDTFLFLTILFHQPRHAETVGLAGKVGASKLFVAAVGWFLATPVDHAVTWFFAILEPGSADAQALIGTSHAVKALVATLNLIIASFQVGTVFFLFSS